MNIEVFLVANGGGIENNLLNVQGGGWEHYSAAFFPATIRGVVCGVATLDDDEIGTTPVLTFEASDAEGNDLAWRGSITVDGVRPAPPAGVPLRVPFWVALTAVVLSPTIVKVTLSHNGTEVASRRFAVRDPVSDA